MKEISLKGLNTSLNGKVLRVQAEVSGAEPIWFEINQKYQSMLDTKSVDAFFILYVWIAMEMGVDLRVEAAVSKQLSDSVLNNVKNMFLILCPRLRDINITVLKQISCPPNNFYHSATGFSGGVDSWYTALKAVEIDNPYAYYMFANTGQHGEYNVEEVVAQRAAIAKNALKTLDAPLIVVDSNIDNVFKERFQQRDVIGNIACVLLLQEGISSYSYSSSYAPEDSKVAEHYDMSIMDPYLIPALSTERIEFRPIGIGATRIQKLRYISNAEKFSNKIYVCIEKELPIKNCGHCFKCRRTQLALDSIGEMELIKNNFGFSFFQQIRSASLIGLFASARKDNLDLEVTEELEEKYGIKVLYYKFLGTIWSVIRNYVPGGLKWRSMAKKPYLW